jgi:ATP-dependent DNA ligase
MIGPNGCATKVERTVTKVIFPRYNREDSMFTQTVIRALSRLGLDQRGTDPHPRQPAPMLLQKADAMFASPDWTYEPKRDGFRVLASVRDGHVKLVSRNGHSFTNLFGPVSVALRGFPTPILQIAR